MHILLIHQAFVSIDEAGGTRHHEMAQYLESQGHQITIITSPVSYLTGLSRSRYKKFAESDELSPGITLIRAYAYQALHKSFFHRLINFFSFMISSFLLGVTRKDIDLVWGTTPPIFQGFTAWLIALLRRKPLLFEVRDLWPAFAVAVGVLKNKTIIQMSEWLEQFLYKRADHVIVNSPGYIKHVTDRGARAVSLIPNGVNPEMFLSDDLAFR
nr:glycosyltransferase family 4 protein [Anaerolineaceae bacterium]